MSSSPGPWPDPTPRQRNVLDVLGKLIHEVVGEDELEGIEIDMDTSFAYDLEMESIEFVVLAEELQERFGERLDFVGWFATLELDEIIEMKVGRVVEFVAASLDADAA